MLSIEFLLGVAFFVFMKMEQHHNNHMSALFMGGMALGCFMVDIYKKLTKKEKK
jgi:hypothetical protein